MDICALNPFFYPYMGGTEKVLMEVYSRLSKDHNITLISGMPRHMHLAKREEINGISVVRLKTDYIDLPGLPIPFPLMHGIRDAIKSSDADLYHINNRYLYYWDTLSAILQKKERMAITIHNALPKGIDFWTDSMGLLYDIAWGRRIMHKADLITGVSKNTVATTVPAKDMHKAKVIYNGINIDMFKPRRGRGHVSDRYASTYGGHAIKILTNGRLVPQKGQIYLINALKMFIDDGNDASLTIIGTGPMHDTLMKLSKKLGIGDRIRIISGIDENELPYYYNAADLFVLPSTYEPGSIALIEAMASGTPAIATRIGGIPELMGRCGLYVKPKDSYDIYKKLNFFIDNKRAMSRLAKDAHSRAIENHDWDKIALRYAETFEKAVRR